MSSCSIALCFFFLSSRRRHTRYIGDWSSDVCSSDLHDLSGRTDPSSSNPVVRNAGNNAGDECAVPVFIQWSEILCVEIPAEHVINIAVAIIIHSRATVKLAGVHPIIVNDVLMIDRDTTVDDGNNY